MTENKLRIKSILKSYEQNYKPKKLECSKKLIEEMIDLKLIEAIKLEDKSFIYARTIKGEAFTRL